MNTNRSVWDYYSRGDGSYSVDPLYAPYVKVEVPREKRRGCEEESSCPVFITSLRHDPTLKSECPCGNTLVHPAHVRRGWGHRFQKKFAHYPCPTGYRDDGDGYCVPSVPESEPIFYSHKAFLPKHQHHYGYARPHHGELFHPERNEDQTTYSSVAPEFENYSINPWTGLREISYHSTPQKGSRDYMINPTGDSLFNL